MKEIDRKIKKMPSKKTLEKFLEGMSGNPTVVFNVEKGEFEILVPEDKLGQPKTEQGRKWRGLK